MRTIESVQALREAVSGSVTVDPAGFGARVSNGLSPETIDLLAFQSVFGSEGVRRVSRWLLSELGRERGILPASIYHLYEARGRGQWEGLAVPAINIRGLTYDVARAVIRAARAQDAAAFIFEIARSEIGYTSQRPDEYAAVLIAAALREGYSGPLFIQGDHFQINLKRFRENSETELEAVRSLIREAVAAGFYQIDIDASTLVDLSRPTIAEQQAVNARVTAELTAVIRSQEPDGVRIAVGGEIGEVGGHNTTEEEFRAFMEQYAGALGKLGDPGPGLSKISIQTGTTHGGVPLADGTVASVAIDFAAIKRISEVARKDYGLAGAVQHGASTLPLEVFDRFVEAGVAEVHLATEFQNIIYDHPAFPAELRAAIYDHLSRAHADERAPGQTEAQFLYKTRKKAWGPFKRAVWEMPEEIRKEIRRSIEEKTGLLLERLAIVGTAPLVKRHITPVPRRSPVPAELT
jgi:fructose/tagatose bisphosphate aldolase